MNYNKEDFALRNLPEYPDYIVRAEPVYEEGTHRIILHFGSKIKDPKDGRFSVIRRTFTLGTDVDTQLKEFRRDCTMAGKLGIEWRHEDKD